MKWDNLIKKAQNYLQASGPDEAIQKVLELMEEYRSKISDWSKFCSFSSIKYTRNIVVRDVSVEVLILCWEPGQYSPVHDHDGSECLMKILFGTLVELSLIHI